MSAPRPATLQQALLRWQEVEAPGSLEVHGQGERSWAAIAVAARGRAQAMQEGGLGPGDRVALVLPTGFPFVECFLGALLAGAVPVPLYPPLRLGRLEEYQRRTARMLAAAGCRLLLTERRLAALLGPAVERAALPLGCQVVAADAPGHESFTPHRGAVHELALVQFSSGTTVDPKPVPLSHGQVVANLSAMLAAVPGGAGEQVGVSWLPLYHDMGLVGFLLQALWTGRPLVLLPPERFLARPRLWLELLHSHGATVSAAPDFAYSLCADRLQPPELEGLDLSRWRLALCGAEPVQPSTLRRFARCLAPTGFDPRALTPVYGLSEATLAVSFGAPDRPFSSLAVDARALAARGEVLPRAGGRELASVGRPLPGVELSLRGEDGGELGEDRVGRIHVRGPSVLRARPGWELAAADASGWLDTGDLGFRHGGELYVCGRSKDVIVLRGEKHDPQAIEERLRDTPGLRAGCVVAVGMPGEGGREELVVLAERARDADPRDDEALARELGRRVRAGAGLDPAQVAVLAAGTLPRTSSGKLRRAEAARRWQAGTLAPAGEVGLWSLLRAQWDGWRALRRHRAAGGDG